MMVVPQVGLEPTQALRPSELKSDVSTIPPLGLRDKLFLIHFIGMTEHNTAHHSTTIFGYWTTFAVWIMVKITFHIGILLLL